MNLYVKIMKMLLGLYWQCCRNLYRLPVHGTNLIMLNLSLIIRLWRDFFTFTWQSDFRQMTGGDLMLFR